MGRRPIEDRFTMPVIERYVRRLLHDSDKQYQAWKKRENERLNTNLTAPTEPPQCD